MNLTHSPGLVSNMTFVFLQTLRSHSIESTLNFSFCIWTTAIVIKSTSFVSKFKSTLPVSFLCFDIIVLCHHVLICIFSLPRIRLVFSSWLKLSVMEPMDKYTRFVFSFVAYMHWHSIVAFDSGNHSKPYKSVFTTSHVTIYRFIFDRICSSFMTHLIILASNVGISTSSW